MTLKIAQIYYPFNFNNEYLKAHNNLEEDLKDILERSGFIEDFSGKYMQRLTYLEKAKEDCYKRRDWFEKLKVVKNLYSIKFNKSQKNIRILFSFVEFRGRKYAILLHAFEEKDNKNMSKYSYDKATPVALKRLEEVLN